MHVRPYILPFLLLVPLHVATATRAEAQVVPSPYEFIDTNHDAGPYLGYAFETRGELDMGPGGGVMVGARYGIELGGPFALEGNAFLLPTDRNVYEPTLEEDETFRLLGNTSALVGGLDGRLRFTVTGPRTWNRLAPYILMGGGVATDFRRRNDLEEALSGSERFRFGPSFLGVLGTGTRWLPTDNTSIRAEATLNVWRLGTPAEFTRVETEERSVPDREWAGVGAVVLGFSYRF